MRELIWGKFHLEYEKVSFDIDAILKLKNKMIDDLNKLTRCLEIYLAYLINVENCSALSVIENLNVNWVLSFNYTDTYRRIYDNGSKKIEYDYIHGVAKRESSMDDCNMILGIDEYLMGDYRDKDNEFVEFKKFYQRIFKGTGNHYTEWISQHKHNLAVFKNHPNPPTLNVYIFGHSLDNTDGDILRDFILQDSSVITIFYHNKEALGKQIANLVAVIGEEELIKRTNKSTQTIYFVSIENV